MAKKKIARKAAKRKPVKSVRKDSKCLAMNDLSMVKLSTVAFVLFLITVWPALLALVLRAHWGWYLAAAIILGIKPMRKYCM